jgi:hypothetical protein
MENNNEGEWQTTSCKKNERAQPIADTVNTQCASSNNAFALLDEEVKEITSSQHSTGVSAQVVPIVANAKKVAWGDDSEPDVNQVTNVIAHNLAQCDDFEQSMKFLQSAMAAITASAANIVEKQRTVANNDKSSERETVRGLHNLALFGRSFSQSMSDNLIELTTVITSIEKQKKEILDGWNTFVHDLNKENVTENVQIPKTMHGSFLEALEGIRAPQHSNTQQIRQVVTNTTVTSIGMVDVTCPTSTDVKNVPLFGIQYNPALGCFMINLEGSVYSFGTGQFMLRKNKNTKGESTMYGKRCNPRTMSCNGASCTYYHDPLKFTKNPHTERNMAVPYITEDLIKSIASDQDIMTNAPFSSNPFIVEDIVQLAGMLLLKAISVKNIIKSTRGRSSGKFTGPHIPNNSNKK